MVPLFPCLSVLAQGGPSPYSAQTQGGSSPYSAQAQGGPSPYSAQAQDGPNPPLPSTGVKVRKKIWWLKNLGSGG